ncbi:hypothetical protein ACH3O9_11390 [Leeuwenhoekiella sp. A16]|uniref:hypothetical protein n=1 Tax=Leeuwenhoekiella sp. A16 TaxID=3141462 RepID=UPI003A80F356
METTINSNIVTNNEKVFAKSSEIFVDFTEEEKLNNFLDKVLNIKKEFKELFGMLDNYVEDAIKELTGDIDRKGLKLRNVYLKKIKQSINSLLSTIADADTQTKASFLTEKACLQVYVEEVGELIKDIEMRSSNNKQLDELLADCPDF